MIDLKKHSFIVVILLSSNLFGQSSLATFNLNEKISSISQNTIVFYNGGKNGQSPLDSTYYFFNQKGYLTKEINNGTGTYCSYIRYFNSQGNLLEEMCRFGEHSKKVFIYNENQLLIKSLNYDGGPGITEYKYNEANQLISEEYRDRSELIGPSFRWIVKEYIYNEFGNLKTLFTQRAETVSSNFSSWTTETYEYDSIVRLISVFKLDTNLNEIERWRKTTLKYDDLSNLVSEVDLFSDSTLITVKYEYLNNRVVYKSKIGHTYKPSNNTWENLKYEWKYEYDLYGNCIYLKEITVEQRFEYEYDDFGNWTKQTKYNMWSEGLTVTHREIEYYD